jgi:hypothetical protein
MAKLMSFKDMLPTGLLANGEDEYIKYRRRRQKRIDTTSEQTEVDEALTVQQRIQRGRMMKRIKHKIKLGREKAKRRMASKDTLEKRSLRQARINIFKKLTKGMDKSELSFSRRAEIEKRLGSPTMKRKLAMMSKRLFKDVRKKEIERKRGKKSDN